LGLSLSAGGSRKLSFQPVYIAAVSCKVDGEPRLLSVNSVNDTIIAHAQLIKALQYASQRLGAHILENRRQPSEFDENTLSDALV
jgi:hypothetical protein